MTSSVEMFVIWQRVLYIGFDAVCGVQTMAVAVLQVHWCQTSATWVLRRCRNTSVLALKVVLVEPLVMDRIGNTKYPMTLTDRHSGLLQPPPHSASVAGSVASAVSLLLRHLRVFRRGEGVETVMLNSALARLCGFAKNQRREKVNGHDKVIVTK